MDTLDDMLPTYFQDFWNYFDWIVYFLILLVVVGMAFVIFFRMIACHANPFGS